MAIKLTVTLDDDTVRRLRQTAECLGKPKSHIVREAIHDYSERIGRLSERERLRLLKAFDELVPAIPERPVSEVQKELREIRRARRGGGRRSPVQNP
ncbi:ribbon-helix-helix protein, CopG family [Acidobacteria bacterium AH-259-A15]|nr:ribbon-helix-helix protein, CopG family [Acidobacteria bacterium AH-259-A15]